MTQHSYSNPPITEAIIEIRHSQPHDPSKLKKAVKRFRKIYANYTPMSELQVKVEIQGATPVTNATPQNYHRLSSSDMTQMLTFKGQNFTVSQLAPYQGWDEFFNRFKRDFEEWKKQTGYQEIVQIGVRFINRIDIPLDKPVTVYEKFLNVYPLLPSLIEPISHYAIQVEQPLNDLGCILRLNSAVVKSPLAEHISIVVDQDIIKKDSPPQKEIEIYSLLNEIRVKKNEIFEACITDRAREAFRNE
jgi:uncharacterized protein (TIGR04255 family)